MKKIATVLPVIILIVFASFSSDPIQGGSESSSAAGRSGAPATHSYSIDRESIFPNPERGWHNRRDIDGRGGNDDRDFSDVKAAGYTLVHSYLRLDDFRETDKISQAYLDDLQEGLDAIRKYGLKIVLRPTHVWSESPSVPEERILKQIEQLNEVISANADVICHLETGYLGKWGEWHSGLYTDLSNRKDGDTRYRIVKRILETTPDNIPLAMRYPMHIREILDELPVPECSEPLTQVQRDRIGHHNDCFLFNETDRGTYARLDVWFGDQTLEQQKQYTFDLITSYGGNRMVGGETCSPTIERIDATQDEMAATNWTELNINYWGEAIDRWQQRMLPANETDPAESEFDRISRKLGYRLCLEDATFPDQAKAGGNFTISANLRNDGYAGVIKKRPLFLVFDNGTDRYNIPLEDVDVRTWLSGKVSLSVQTVKLPQKMNPGTYKLALWLPDASVVLQSRPEYSIRLANHEIWDAETGYNVLTESVMVRK